MLYNMSDLNGVGFYPHFFFFNLIDMYGLDNRKRK